jgi:hypothetical protein
MQRHSHLCTVYICGASGDPYATNISAASSNDAARQAIAFFNGDFWKGPKPRPDTVLEIAPMGGQRVPCALRRWWVGDTYCNPARSSDLRAALWSTDNTGLDTRFISAGRGTNIRSCRGAHPDTALPRKSLDYLPCSAMIAYERGQTIYDTQQPFRTGIYLVLRGKVGIARPSGDRRPIDSEI